MSASLNPGAACYTAMRGHPAVDSFTISFSRQAVHYLHLTDALIDGGFGGQ